MLHAHTSPITGRATHRLRLSVLALAAVLVSAFVSAGAPASAAPADPRVIPNVAKAYDVLSVAWWKYVLAQPVAWNPLTDDTGARCAIAQAGPGLFIGGGFNRNNPPSARDQCRVPAGRALFFPLVNVVDAHVPGLDTQDTAQAI